MNKKILFGFLIASLLVLLIAILVHIRRTEVPVQENNQENQEIVTPEIPEDQVAPDLLEAHPVPGEGDIIIVPIPIIIEGEQE